MVDYHNVHCKTKCAKKHKGISDREAETCVGHTKKIESDSGEYYAYPDDKADAFFEKKARNRNKNDVKRRNKSRFTDRCEFDSVLLKTGSDGKGYATADTCNYEQFSIFFSRRNIIGFSFCGSVT